MVYTSQSLMDCVIVLIRGNEPLRMAAGGCGLGLFFFFFFGTRTGFVEPRADSKGKHTKWWL